MIDLEMIELIILLTDEYLQNANVLLILIERDLNYAPIVSFRDEWPATLKVRLCFFCFIFSHTSYCVLIYFSVVSRELVADFSDPGGPDRHHQGNAGENRHSGAKGRLEKDRLKLELDWWSF